MKLNLVELHYWHVNSCWVFLGNNNQQTELIQAYKHKSIPLDTQANKIEQVNNFNEIISSWQDDEHCWVHFVAFRTKWYLFSPKWTGTSWFNNRIALVSRRMVLTLILNDFLHRQSRFVSEIDSWVHYSSSYSSNSKFETNSSTSDNGK